MEKNFSQIKQEAQDRGALIFKTSIIGIIVNVLLVGFKAFIGLLTNSIAIVLDAVNNLSDALSSVITIIGMKLASKPADKKHPMGYGRIEYLTSAIISVIVLYAGVSSLVSSVKHIITPEKADYSTVSIIIVAVAVVVKLVLGLYVKSSGKKANSDALVASGKDALFDSIISASTVVAAVVYLAFGVSLEAYLGVIISAIIIKSGLEMLRETLSKILGERIDAEMSHAIKKTVRSVEGVRGAYDLLLNNYGPDTYIASVHIEVPDTFTADKIDSITREIQKRVLAEHNIYITAVGVYSYNTSSVKAVEVREKIYGIINSHSGILQIHGFYFDEDKNSVSVDIVADFDADKDLQKQISEELSREYPEIEFDIAMDTDISD